MQCPNCGHHNTDDAKFCSQCGTSLTITCQVCGTVAGLGAAFCSNCGASLSAATGEAGTELTRYLPPELLTKLQSARSGRAMHGERRTVTMLFADLQGSTAAAEQLDPEDWAEIINGAFEHLIAPVYRYEGTLARLQGDAVLAFFGAPIAHEDDPVRALRAGLEIIEAIGRYRPAVEAQWGIPIEARVGIHTGLVVVGEVGSDLRVEYTALGDAINLAARMEQTAQPGTVQVTDHTRSLVGTRFEFEELGPVEIKGKSEAVTAHRVLRFVADREDLSPSSLVGRAAELGQLADLQRRLGTGSGWIVTITADAGVGKSRLLQEFHAAAGKETTLAHRFDQPCDIAWMTGAGRSYDTATPFASVRDVLGRWWGLDGVDDPFGQVEAAIADVGYDGVDGAALLSHIGGVQLSGSPAHLIESLAPPVLHERASAAFIAYLEAVAATRPLLIVLEDVHWADDLSLALFETTMELTERLPIGLVLALRPYREDRSWRLHQVAERDHPHRYHPIALSPLDADDGAALLDAHLGERQISPETRAGILERAAGNPLFLEEIVRTLSESGSEELVVPSSLTAMLTARLDRLDDGSRYVVQLASVIGAEFDRRTLAALMGGSSPDPEIIDLLRRGILVEGTRGTLAFRHVLMQEAAYSTILRKTRRELHRMVADHLTETQPDQVQEIARHLIEAGDREAAFPFLVEAGVQSTRAMALSDAIRLLSDAIAHTPMEADPQLIVVAHDALGAAHSLVPDLSQAAAAYQSLYDYGERQAQPEARAAALNRLGFATAALSGDIVQASGYLEQARSIAEQSGDEVGLAEYHMNSCFVASLGGDLQLAVGHDEQTVALGERVGIDRIRLEGLLRRAVNYAALLELDQADATAAAAIAAASEAGAEDIVATVESFASAVVIWSRGNLPKAVELMEQAQGPLERYGSFYTAINQVRMGSILFELGDPEAALSRFVDARRAGGQAGQTFVVAAAAAGMAFLYASAGMPELVPQLREEALAALEAPMGAFLASSVWVELGWAGIASGDLAAAEADLTRGLAASSISQFMARPRLLLGQALAFIGQGRNEEAATALEEARQFIRTRGLVAAQPLLSLVEGEWLAATGQTGEATESLRTAHEAAMTLGERCIMLPILSARARLADLAGDGAAAEQHRTTARQLIDTIVGSILDQELAEGLRARWLDDVERLGTSPTN